MSVLDRDVIEVGCQPSAYSRHIDISYVVESNGEKLVYQLVMPEDADASKGLISTTSPIGRAFLNKEPGDTVKVVTPGGTREFEIEKLVTIHDAE